VFRSTCQQHFLDLCDLLAQAKPAEADPEGAWYTFEKGVLLLKHELQSYRLSAALFVPRISTSLTTSSQLLK
jgi:hypothetical protein